MVCANLVEPHRQPAVRRLLLTARVLGLVGAVPFVAALGVGGYLIGESAAPSAVDADDARRVAYEAAVTSAEQEAFVASREGGESDGLVAGEESGIEAGTQTGSSRGEAAAAAELAAIEAAQAEAAAAEAAAAEPAIPARCSGIPTNTTAYTMCINAPGFPDSP